MERDSVENQAKDNDDTKFVTPKEYVDKIGTNIYTKKTWIKSYCKSKLSSKVIVNIKNLINAVFKL